MEEDTLLETLEALLDTLIPPSPEKSLPGAGEAGLSEVILAKVGGLEILRAGLEALEEKARSGHDQSFAALDLASRSAALSAHNEADPGLLAGLLFHTYGSYYALPAVLEGIGLEGRPPHPLGYPIHPVDESLLDPVKQRTGLFRST